MIPLGAWLRVLTGNSVLLKILGGVIPLRRSTCCYLMLRRPEDLAWKRITCRGRTCIG